MSEDRHRIQARVTACELIDRISEGDPDAVAATVQRLIRPEPGSVHLLRDVLAKLLDAAADAVVAHTDDLGASAAYELQLRDSEGRLIEIDALEPSTRALVRALLARLAGHRLDMLDQLELALAPNRRSDAARLLSVSLLWTLDALAMAEG